MPKGDIVISFTILREEKEMFQVKKRDGSLVEFDMSKIATALSKAFNAKQVNYTADILKLAYQDGVEKAAHSSFKCFGEQMKSSFMFGIKVNAFIMALSTICLYIANYTPVTHWLAVPMTPILSALGLADAETIAASSVVGILALSLPATLIKGKAVATASAFFVVVLSTCQIIFFTESANAILESDIPLNFWDLVLIFIIRTIILIPVVALLAHLFY